ncbi:MAG: ATP-binding protein [Gemmatimonadota bacterium]
MDFVLELPNDLRAIEQAVEFLASRAREAGFDEGLLRLNFRVGVTEALANAMLYGNRGDENKNVRVDASVTADRICVRVRDEGRGFDPEHLDDPTLPAHRARVGGRGIFLINKLMDQVEFNEAGNAITMVLNAPPREAP